MNVSLLIADSIIVYTCAQLVRACYITLALRYALRARRILNMDNFYLKIDLR